jgi:hypothetical protein
LYYRGGDPSSVQGVKYTEDRYVNVYSLDGVLYKKRVEPAKALEGLKKGIYIVGDKKIEVK